MRKYTDDELRRIDRVLHRLCNEAECDLIGAPLHDVIIRQAKRELGDVPMRLIGERLYDLLH